MFWTRDVAVSTSQYIIGLMKRCGGTCTPGVPGPRAERIIFQFSPQHCALAGSAFNGFHCGIFTYKRQHRSVCFRNNKKKLPVILLLQY